MNDKCALAVNFGQLQVLGLGSDLSFIQQQAPIDPATPPSTPSQLQLWAQAIRNPLRSLRNTFSPRMYLKNCHWPLNGFALTIISRDTPTRFSGELVTSLQDSPQSDTTRSANLELKIQSRVTSELERLAAEEADKLREISEKVSQDSESTPSSAESPTLLDRITGDASDKQRKADLSHSSVSKEIATLKAKLEQRKKLEALDPAVEKAKEQLVQCLRENDRRPLDCWQAREAFKREVGRLEREFVERTVR